jgi:hypothetical protein
MPGFTDIWGPSHPSPFWFHPVVLMVEGQIEDVIFGRKARIERRRRKSGSKRVVPRG